MHHSSGLDKETSLKSARRTCFGTRAAYLEPIQLTSRHQFKVRPAFLSGQQGSQLPFYHLSVDEFPIKGRPLIGVHVGDLLSGHLPIFIDFPYKAASILMEKPTSGKITWSIDL